MEISNTAATDIDTFLDFEIAQFLYQQDHTIQP